MTTDKTATMPRTEVARHAAALVRTAAAAGATGPRRVALDVAREDAADPALSPFGRMLAAALADELSAQTGSPSWEHRKAVQGGTVFDTLPAVDDWSF